VQIQDQAVVLRKSLSGENHLLLVFFLRSHGLRYVLARRSGKENLSRTIPDLFENGDIVIQQKAPDRPGFLKEFHPAVVENSLGRSYKALQAASHLAAFYEKNLVHMEDFTEAWELLGNTFETMRVKPRPDITLLKALVLFARSEGYPVISQWLKEKPEADQQTLTRLLKSAVEETDLDESSVRSCLAILLRFFDRDTDLVSSHLLRAFGNCQ